MNSKQREIIFEKTVLKSLNKHSSPGLDRITPELIQNEGPILVKCITIVLQACYILGYFPKFWKQDKRIYIKKPTKTNYHIPNSYRPI